MAYTGQPYHLVDAVTGQPLSAGAHTYRYSDGNRVADVWEVGDAFYIKTFGFDGDDNLTSESAFEDLGLPEFDDLPSITGTAQVLATLTGVPGTHDGVSATYRWLADGVAIADETEETLELGVAQLGKVITFEVTATNEVGNTVAVSAPTAAVIAA